MPMVHPEERAFSIVGVAPMNGYRQWLSVSPSRRPYGVNRATSRYPSPSRSRPRGDCLRAGASKVHVHILDEDGQNTNPRDLYERAIGPIRETVTSTPISVIG